MTTPDDDGQRNGRPPVPDPTVLTTQLVDRAIAAFREYVDTRLGGMDLATKLVADQVKALPDESSTAHMHLRNDFDRDMLALRQLLMTEISGEITNLTTRITGMDEATHLLAENVRAVPTDIDKAARALREILAGEIRSVQDVALEKFTAIEGTFASNALALTAALAAQKEAAAEAKKSSDLAIDKSEKTTQETIRANQAQVASALAALQATIGDLKDRVVRIESGGLATSAARIEQRTDSKDAGTAAQTDRIAAAAGARATISAAIAALAIVVTIVLGILLAVKK